jgi:hypothetical protein
LLTSPLKESSTLIPLSFQERGRNKKEGGFAPLSKISPSSMRAYLIRGV